MLNTDRVRRGVEGLAYDHRVRLHVIRGGERRISEQVSTMSENDRIVLTLRHVDELSIREIAEELKLAVDTAKKRYVRAIRRLRAACEDLNPNDETSE